MEFWDTNRLSNLDQTKWLSTKKKKKERTCRTVNFAVPADHKVKLKEIENEMSTEAFLKNWKILWNMKVTVILIVIGSFGTVTKGMTQGQADLEISGLMESNPNYSIVEIEKTGDLKGLAFTQTRVKNNQLKLVWNNS